MKGWVPLRGAADLLKPFYSDFAARIVEQHADVISAIRDQVLATCNELAKLVPEEPPSRRLRPTIDGRCALLIPIA